MHILLPIFFFFASCLNFTPHYNLNWDNFVHLELAKQNDLKYLKGKKIVTLHQEERAE